MQKWAFYPQMLEAACEFWFEPGQPWRVEISERLEERLSQVFPVSPGINAPFLWYEENYLSICASSPECSAPMAHERIIKAFKLYQMEASPSAVQSLSLRYHFQFAAEAVDTKYIGQTRVWQTPDDFLRMTLQQGAESAARLEISYLLTKPDPIYQYPVDRCLHKIQRKLDAAFYELRRRKPLVKGFASNRADQGDKR